ncbi:GSCOCG00008817001-RA-CDS [Cotesia congregata]|nr:GSCOCG00008817001-RA-CDS [Cotesia congregata]
MYFYIQSRDTNSTPLVIIFESDVITTSFGSTFWLTLSGGLLSFVLASVVIILDLRYPNALAVFLGIDILDQYDEYFIREFELEYTRKKNNKDESMELGKMSEQISKNHFDVMLQLKRRSTVERVQKKLVRLSTMPIKVENIYDDTATQVTYANQESLSLPGPSIQETDKLNLKPPLPRRKRK